MFNKPYHHASWLIKQGINIHQIDQGGSNALFEADYETSKLLIEGKININQKNLSGLTALFYTHDLKTTELLIKAGADINIRDKKENNILMYSTENLAPLYIESGVDIHAINDNGENSLFHFSQSPEIAKMLINKNINIHQINNHGENALFDADVEVAKILLSLGINAKQKSHAGEDVITYADFEKTKLLINELDDLSFYTEEKMNELEVDEYDTFTPEKRALIETKIAEIKAQSEKQTILNSLKDNSPENKIVKRL